MITPTVGRVIWYRRPHSSDQNQPEAGLITYVHDDRHVNIAYFNHDGKLQGVTMCYLDQGDQPRPADIDSWAEWMPYQKGQAAKTEALEKAASASA